MLIATDLKEILYTGSVISFNNEQLVFTFDEVSPPLIARVIFVEDTNDASARIALERVDNSTLNIRLFNHNNSLGLGNIVPMQIGNMHGQLFLNYRVYSLPESTSKLFHYTWYRDRG